MHIDIRREPPLPVVARPIDSVVLTLTAKEWWDLQRLALAARRFGSQTGQLDDMLRTPTNCVTHDIVSLVTTLSEGL